MDKAISLATSIYHHFHFRAMLTPDEEALYEQAVNVLDEAKLLNKDGELIDEDEE